MSIHERIRDLRKGKNMSQAELAKEIGVSSGNVGDWERGRAKPGADALISLMNFFKVSADYLLTGKPDPDCCKKDIEHNDSNKLSEEENDMIAKYRQLDYEDKEDIKGLIELKHDRLVKRGMLSNCKNGGTGEEAATNETA